eukprot:TRINITY_DN8623_c0_g1_i1.p1 TRINITY_DN8623_c0_g1~~TRINITY_DN8623_c0_g1_i1.p1  ORF type:complete len:603 (-),score=136.69 TRINITY_DN8623_c0_g1_i1:23-1831(-)
MAVGMAEDCQEAEWRSEDTQRAYAEATPSDALLSSLKRPMPSDAQKKQLTSPSGEQVVAVSEQDEDASASAEALRLNRLLQEELQQALAEIAQASVGEKEQTEALEGVAKLKKYRKPPLPVGASFFSDPKDPKSTPPKNLDGIRRHLFREENVAVGMTSRRWEPEEEEQLRSLFHEQVTLEGFRLRYDSKQSSVPPGARAQLFKETGEEIYSKKPEELWAILGHKVEWERIARRMKLRGFPRDAKRCYMQFVHYLHPDLHHGSFTKKEDMMLMKLATQHGGFSWDAIAEGMPKARTGWRCFARYQKSLNPKLLRSDWSADDKRLLEQSRQELGHETGRGCQGQRQLWHLVVARMGPGRTCDQVQTFAKRYVDKEPFRPRHLWTPGESRRLILAVKVFGDKSWNLVASQLPGRSGYTCYCRWHWTDSPDLKRTGSASELAKFLKDKTLPWTPEEDQTLLRALKKYGVGNWSLVQVDLPGRTSRQILERFRALNPGQQANVHALMLATKKRMLPIMRHRSKRVRSELVASDFALRLREEPWQEAGWEGATRLTTGDDASDRHLTLINTQRLRSLAIPDAVLMDASPEAIEQEAKTPAVEALVED